MKQFPRLLWRIAPLPSRATADDVRTTPLLPRRPSSACTKISSPVLPAPDPPLPFARPSSVAAPLTTENAKNPRPRRPPIRSPFWRNYSVTLSPTSRIPVCCLASISPPTPLPCSRTAPRRGSFPGRRPARQQRAPSAPPRRSGAAGSLPARRRAAGAAAAVRAAVRSATCCALRPVVPRGGWLVGVR